MNGLKHYPQVSPRMSPFTGKNCAADKDPGIFNGLQVCAVGHIYVSQNPLYLIDEGPIKMLSDSGIYNWPNLSLHTW